MNFEGGCLRNTMGLEVSGTPSRRLFIRGMEDRFPFLTKSPTTCPQTYSWMGNYGNIWFSRLLLSICVLRIFFSPRICRFGREAFQESMKVAQRMDSSAIDWNSFRYMVFDVPDHRGTYAERYSKLGYSSSSATLSSFSLSHKYRKLSL